MKKQKTKLIKKKAQKPICKEPWSDARLAFSLTVISPKLLL